MADCGDKKNCEFSQHTERGGATYTSSLIYSNWYKFRLVVVVVGGEERGWLKVTILTLTNINIYNIYEYMYIYVCVRGTKYHMQLFKHIITSGRERTHTYALKDVSAAALSKNYMNVLKNYSFFNFLALTIIVEKTIFCISTCQMRLWGEILHTMTISCTNWQINM